MPATQVSAPRGARYWNGWSISLACPTASSSPPTGYTGRELYAVADRANHLYMVGSMGCAPSLGLGLALARPDLEVIVVDGDGAALMRMGNLATVGSYAPRNFRHLPAG